MAEGLHPVWLSWKLMASSNPVFRAYATYSCILTLKMLLLGIYTAVLKYKKAKTINPLNLPSKFKLLKAVLPNITLQRVRMVHDNDLEIVLPHLIVGLMYVLMDPTKSVAINGFRLFTISRILYSAVYCAFPSWQAVWCSCLVVNYSLFCYMTINCLFITSIRFHMVFHDLLCYCW